MGSIPAALRFPCKRLGPPAFSEVSPVHNMTQCDAGHSINYAGIGSISNPASRCVTLR